MRVKSKNKTRIQVARLNVKVPIQIFLQIYSLILETSSEYDIVSMVAEAAALAAVVVKVMILLRTHTSCILMWPKIAAIKRNFTTSAKSVIKPNKTGIAALVYH